ncbi:hypothetical protein ACSD7O_22215 [Methylorubrum extorquens]|uniref:hypothetical protein n=1 Tax=Methylorubrum extorquens TaxID=408 RepID=UPI003F5E0D29
MGVREGGSYVVDPKTGDAKRTGGTEPVTFTTEVEGAAPAEAAEVASAPAALPAPAESVEATSGRRSARSTPTAKE